MIIYKIRDTKTGLYSTGGTHPQWKATGKTWNTKGALSSHLSLLAERRWYGCHVYDDAEIVEIEVKHEELTKISVGDRLRQMSLAKQERDRLARERIVKAQQDRRREEYEKLKKEFEG